MSFSSQIRTLLQKRDISQAAFAEKLGISRARLNNYVMGRSEPDYETLIRMARVLEVSTDYLLEMSTDGSQKPNPSSHYFEINPDLVLSAKRPDPLPGSYDWIPMYKTQSQENLLSVTLLGNTPLAWLRISENHIDKVPGRSSFALYVDDLSMYPVFVPGDFVFVRPMVSYLFLNENKAIQYCVVRMSAEDKIGLMIRRCYVHDDVITMIPVNPNFTPTVISLKSTSFVPIVGQVVTMSRSFTRLTDLELM